MIRGLTHRVPELSENMIFQNSYRVMAIRVLRVTTRLSSLRSLRGGQDVRRCGQEEAAGGIWRHQPSIPRPGDWRHWLRLSIEQPRLARWGVRHQHSPVWVTRPETTPSLRENCLWPQRSHPASLTQVKYSDLDRSLTPECSTRSCPPP